MAQLPAEIVDWMLARSLTVQDNPPGAYLGLAGIAYAFQDLGHAAVAEEVMALLHRSPLLYEDPGVLLGVAGWGIASLDGLHRPRSVTGAAPPVGGPARSGRRCGCGPRRPVDEARAVVRRITGELAGLAKKAVVEAEQLLVNARRALRRADAKPLSSLPPMPATRSLAAAAAGAAEP